MANENGRYEQSWKGYAVADPLHQDSGRTQSWGGYECATVVVHYYANHDVGASDAGLADYQSFEVVLGIAHL